MTNTVDLSVREIIKEDTSITHFPGFDVLRTLLLSIATLCLVAIITYVSPEDKVNAIVLEDLINWSKALAFLCLIFCAFSMSKALEILDNHVSSLSGWRVLLTPRILINFAMSFFFAIILLWIKNLGGLHYSPFATILSMSPIILILQFVFEQDSDVENLVKVLNRHRKSKLTYVRSNIGHRLYTMMNEILDFLPLAIVGITLYHARDKTYFLSTNFSVLLQSAWYTKMHCFMYYASVGIAMLGLLPKQMTRKLSKRIFV